MMQLRRLCLYFVMPKPEWVNKCSCALTDDLSPYLFLFFQSQPLAVDIFSQVPLFQLMLNATSLFSCQHFATPFDFESRFILQLRYWLWWTTGAYASLCRMKLLTFLFHFRTFMLYFIWPSFKHSLLFFTSYSLMIQDSLPFSFLFFLCRYLFL